jgi:hypothetical protein
MGTSVGAAIDYLVAGLAGPLAVADSTAAVIDGIATTMSQSMVFIGKADPGSPTAQTGSQSLLELGAGSSDEDYDIPCFVYAYRPGPTTKPARDAAITLFDVVAKFVAADRTFGGVLNQGRYAELINVALNQDVDEDSGSVRIVWLSFAIHCRNHYIP